MANVGDTATFTVYGDLPPGEDYAFVWKWWDGTVSVTATQSTTKVINMGGNPDDGNLLRYTVTMVDADGNSQDFNGQTEVNNPPTLVPPPTVTPNGQTYPFSTVLAVDAYDLDDDSISPHWYQGGTYLGVGTQVYVGSVSGTYNGTFAGLQNGTGYSYAHSATQNTDIRLLLIDAGTGTTSFDFNVRGRQPVSPFSSYTVTTPGVIYEVNATEARVGPAQTIEVSVYTPVLSSEPTFEWSYEEADGWVVASTSSGTTVLQDNGTYLNTDSKALDTETAGSRLIRVTITDTASSESVEVIVSVDLASNSDPEDIAVTTSAVGGVANVGDLILFEVSASDPENDLVFYKWTFTTPSLTLWGSRVLINTSDLSAGQTLAGTVRAIDRLNADVSAAIPTVTLS